MWFDHIPWAVADLDSASDEFRRLHGLGWSGEGRHPQGTLTRVIPIAPTQYIELLQAYDTSLEWGADVAAAVARREPLLGWSIEVDDIEWVSSRTGIAIHDGTVELEDGSRGGWKSVSPQDDDLPFFIRYGRSHGERVTGNQERFAAAAHTCDPAGITWVEVGGDEPELRRWIGDTELEIRFVGGRPGLHRFAVGTSGGELVLP